MLVDGKRACGIRIVSDTSLRKDSFILLEGKSWAL